MKRKLLFGATLLFIACILTSCESLTDCKVCKNVTYDNGKEISSTSETQYCGTDLLTKEATPDVTIGTLTTKVECR